MDNSFNFNRWFIGSILVLIMVFSEVNATEIKNRVGYEHTALNTKNVQQDTLKYKINYKKYSLTSYLRKINKNYKFQLKPKINDNFLFYEGQYNFYSNKKTKIRTILGSYFKHIFTSKLGFSFEKENNSFVLINEGLLYKNRKHKLSFENYNYFSKRKKYNLNIELQYKYRITKKVDIYVYSVNSKEIKLKPKHRLDLGIYYYF